MRLKKADFTYEENQMCHIYWLHPNGRSDSQIHLSFLRNNPINQPLSFRLGPNDMNCFNALKSINNSKLYQQSDLA